MDSGGVYRMSADSGGSAAQQSLLPRQTRPGRHPPWTSDMSASDSCPCAYSPGRYFVHLQTLYCRPWTQDCRPRTLYCLPWTLNCLPRTAGRVRHYLFGVGVRNTFQYVSIRRESPRTQQNN